MSRMTMASARSSGSDTTHHSAIPRRMGARAIHAVAIATTMNIGTSHHAPRAERAYRGGVSDEFMGRARARAKIITLSHTRQAAEGGGWYTLTLAWFVSTGREAVQHAFFISLETKRLHVLFIPHTIRMIGEIVMPTPIEYRLRADECLKLMAEADQWYVKSALLKMAAEFQKRAERLESLST